MSDITMSLNDTLELDVIIKKWNAKSDDTITVTSDKGHNLKGLNTYTGVFDPQESGTHTIKVNGQELTVEVIKSSTIPDGSQTRPDDVGTTSDPRGIQIEALAEWPKFEVRISSETNTNQNAVLYDPDGNQMTSIDMSSFSSGNVFVIDQTLENGKKYILLANGSVATGFENSKSVPYTSGTNINITRGASGPTATNSNTYAFKEVGNITGNL